MSKKTSKKRKTNRKKKTVKKRKTSKKRNGGGQCKEEPCNNLLTELQFLDLENHLINVERNGFGYKFKKGKHYYFDNEDNDNLYNYTMETGIYQGEEDYREPSFKDIKLLYRDEQNLPYHHDWKTYHKDKGVRPTAIFRFYEIDPNYRADLVSEYLTKGNIHGLETNYLLSENISSYLG